LALAVPAAATLAVMLWGITAPSYWRDEAATLSAVSRSLPQLLRLLSFRGSDYLEQPAGGGGARLPATAFGLRIFDYRNLSRCCICHNLAQN
jgi:hypothetical protein